MAALSEADAISGQIRTVALIAVGSAVGLTTAARSAPKLHQTALHCILCTTCKETHCSSSSHSLCRLPLVAAIFAVWLRDRLWPSRSTARTTIGADRAARKWTEEDLDKVYLIAPSP